MSTDEERIKRYLIPSTAENGRFAFSFFPSHWDEISGFAFGRRKREKQRDKQHFFLFHKS